MIRHAVAPALAVVALAVAMIVPPEGEPITSEVTAPKTLGIELTTPERLPLRGGA